MLFNAIRLLQTFNPSHFLTIYSLGIPNLRFGTEKPYFLRISSAGETCSSITSSSFLTFLFSCHREIFAWKILDGKVSRCGAKYFAT